MENVEKNRSKKCRTEEGDETKKNNNGIASKKRINIKKRRENKMGLDVLRH